jgi:hypothetical protein
MQTVFPAPGFTNSTQFLTPFSGFDIAPVSGYAFKNLLKWSQDQSKSNWIRGNGTIASTDNNGLTTIFIDPIQYTTAIVDEYLDLDPASAILLSTPNTGQALSTTAEVIPSSTYTFSFYAKRGTSTEVKYAVVDNTNSVDIISATSYYSAINSAALNRITITFTTPNNCTSVKLYPIADTSGYGTTFISSLQLELGSSATAYQNTANDVSFATSGIVQPTTTRKFTSVLKDSFVIKAPGSHAFKSDFVRRGFSVKGIDLDVRPTKTLGKIPIQFTAPPDLRPKKSLGTFPIQLIQEPNRFLVTSLQKPFEQVKSLTTNFLVTSLQKPFEQVKAIPNEAINLDVSYIKLGLEVQEAGQNVTARRGLGVIPKYPNQSILQPNIVYSLPTIRGYVEIGTKVGGLAQEGTVFDVTNLPKQFEIIKAFPNEAINLDVSYIRSNLVIKSTPFSLNISKIVVQKTPADKLQVFDSNRLLGKTSSTNLVKGLQNNVLAGKATANAIVKSIPSTVRTNNLSNYDSSLWNYSNQANLGQADPTFNTTFTVTSTTISGSNTRLNFNPTYGSNVAYFQSTSVIKLSDATTGYSALIQINGIQSPYSTSSAYIQVPTSSLSSFAASTGSNWTFQQWSPSVYTQTQVYTANINNLPNFKLVQSGTPYYNLFLSRSDNGLPLNKFAQKYLTFGINMAAPPNNLQVAKVSQGNRVKGIANQLPFTSKMSFIPASRLYSGNSYDYNLLITGQSSAASTTTLTFASQTLVPFQVGDTIRIYNTGFTLDVIVTAATNSSVSFSTTGATIPASSYVTSGSTVLQQSTVSTNTSPTNAQEILYYLNRPNPYQKVILNVSFTTDPNRYTVATLPKRLEQIKQARTIDLPGKITKITQTQFAAVTTFYKPYLIDFPTTRPYSSYSYRFPLTNLITVDNRGQSFSRQAQSLLYSANSITVTGSNTTINLNAGIGQQLYDSSGSSGTLGTFSSPGVVNNQYTYTFTPPFGVYSVSVVAIGGGGAGNHGWSGNNGYNGGMGGGGGGLGWKNNISVIPLQTYTVVVGAGGADSGAGIAGDGTPGGDSYFINNITVLGGGGGAAIGNSPGAGGTYVGTGGGSGGSGGAAAGLFAGSGGGGGGGYAGNGGTGGAANGSLGSAGSGGGGGGGSSGSSHSSGGGGGTGMLGQGSSGLGGATAAAGGFGGSSGSDGTAGSFISGGAEFGGAGGLYGGGGGGSIQEWTSAKGGSGAAGAVRIIWGSGRAFPAINTANLTSINPINTQYYISTDYWKITDQLNGSTAIVTAQSLTGGSITVTSSSISSLNTTNIVYWTIEPWDPTVVTTTQIFNYATANSNAVNLKQTSIYPAINYYLAFGNSFNTYNTVYGLPDEYKEPIDTNKVYDVSKISKFVNIDISTPIDDTVRRNGKVVQLPTFSSPLIEYQYRRAGKINLIPLVKDPLSSRNSRRSGLIQKFYDVEIVNPNPFDAITFDINRIKVLPLIRDVFTDKTIRRSGLVREFNRPLLITPTPDETSRRVGKVKSGITVKTVASNSSIRSYQLSNYPSNLWNLNNAVNLGSYDPSTGGNSFNVISSSTSGNQTLLFYNKTYGSPNTNIRSTDYVRLYDTNYGVEYLTTVNAVNTVSGYISVDTSALSNFAPLTGSPTNWYFQQWSPAVYTTTQVSAVNRQSSVSLKSINYSKEYNSYWAATYAPINSRRPAPNNSVFLLSSTLGVPSNVISNYHLSRYPISYSPDYVYKSVSYTTTLSWNVVDYYVDITVVPEIISSTQGSTPSTTTIYFEDAGSDIGTISAPTPNPIINPFPVGSTILLTNSITATNGTIYSLSSNAQSITATVLSSSYNSVTIATPDQTLNTSLYLTPGRTLYQVADVTTIENASFFYNTSLKPEVNYWSLSQYAPINKFKQEYKINVMARPIDDNRSTVGKASPGLVAKLPVNVSSANKIPYISPSSVYPTTPLDYTTIIIGQSDTVTYTTLDYYNDITPVPEVITSTSVDPGQYTTLYVQPTTQRTLVSTVNGSSYYNINTIAFNVGASYFIFNANNAFVFDAKNFTVEAWIYLTKNNVVQGIFQNWTTGGAFSFEITASNTLKFFYTNAPSGISTVTINGIKTIPLNTWTHVAVARYNNAITIYFNGVVDATLAVSASETMYYYQGVAKTFYIGLASDSGGNFQGYMHGIRIIKGDSAYTAAFSPKVFYDANSSTVLNIVVTASNQFADTSTNSFSLTPSGPSGAIQIGFANSPNILATNAFTYIDIPEFTWIPGEEVKIYNAGQNYTLYTSIVSAGSNYIQIATPSTPIPPDSYIASGATVKTQASVVPLANPKTSAESLFYSVLAPGRNNNSIPFTTQQRVAGSDLNRYLVTTLTKPFEEVRLPGDSYRNIYTYIHKFYYKEVPTFSRVELLPKQFEVVKQANDTYRFVTTYKARYPLVPSPTVFRVENLPKPFEKILSAEQNYKPAKILRVPFYNNQLFFTPTSANVKPGLSVEEITVTRKVEFLRYVSPLKSALSEAVFKSVGKIPLYPSQSKLQPNMVFFLPDNFGKLKSAISANGFNFEGRVLKTNLLRNVSTAQAAGITYKVSTFQAKTPVKSDSALVRPDIIKVFKANTQELSPKITDLRGNLSPFDNPPNTGDYLINNSYLQITGYTDVQNNDAINYYLAYSASVDLLIGNLTDYPSLVTFYFLPSNVSAQQTIRVGSTIGFYAFIPDDYIQVVTSRATVIASTLNSVTVSLNSLSPLTPNVFKYLTILTDSVYPTALASTVRPTTTPRGRLQWTYLSRNSFGIENIGNASTVSFAGPDPVGQLPKAFEIIKSAEYKNFRIENLPKPFEIVKQPNDTYRYIYTYTHRNPLKASPTVFSVEQLPKAFEKLLTPNLSLRPGQIPPVKFYNNTVFDAPKVSITKLNFVLKDFTYNLQANFLPKPFEIVKGDRNKLTIDQFKIISKLTAIKQEGLLYQTNNLPRAFEKIVATDINLRTGQIPPVKFLANQLFFTPQMANLPKAFEQLKTGDAQIPVSFLPKAFELLKGERNQFITEVVPPRIPLKSIVNNVTTSFILPVKPFRNNQVYFTPQFGSSTLGYVLKDTPNRMNLSFLPRAFEVVKGEYRVLKADTFVPKNPARGTPNILFGLVPPVKFYNNTVFYTPTSATLPKAFELIKGEQTKLPIQTFTSRSPLAGTPNNIFTYSLTKQLMKITASEQNLRIGLIPPVKFYNNSVFYTPQFGYSKSGVPLKGLTKESFIANTNLIKPVLFKNNIVFNTPYFASSKLGIVLKSLPNNVILGSSKLGYVNKGLDIESFAFDVNNLPKQITSIKGLNIESFAFDVNNLPKQIAKITASERNLNIGLIPPVKFYNNSVFYTPQFGYSKSGIVIKGSEQNLRIGLIPPVKFYNNSVFYTPQFGSSKLGYVSKGLDIDIKALRVPNLKSGFVSKGLNIESFAFDVNNLPKQIAKITASERNLRIGLIPPIKFYNNSVFYTPQFGSSKLGYVSKGLDIDTKALRVPNLKSGFVAKDFVYNLKNGNLDKRISNLISREQKVFNAPRLETYDNQGFYDSPTLTIVGTSNIFHDVVDYYIYENDILNLVTLTNTVTTSIWFTNPNADGRLYFLPGNYVQLVDFANGKVYAAQVLAATTNSVTIASINNFPSTTMYGSIQGISPTVMSQIDVFQSGATLGNASSKNFFFFNVTPKARGFRTSITEWAQPTTEMKNPIVSFLPKQFEKITASEKDFKAGQIPALKFLRNALFDAPQTGSTNFKLVRKGIPNDSFLYNLGKLKAQEVVKGTRYLEKLSILTASINVRSVIADLARDTLIFGREVDRNNTLITLDPLVGHIDLRELVKGTRDFDDLPVLPVNVPKRKDEGTDYQVFHLPINYGNLFKFRTGDFKYGSVGFTDVTFRPPPPIQFWS